MADLLQKAVSDRVLRAAKALVEARSLIWDQMPETWQDEAIRQADLALAAADAEPAE